VSLTRNLPHNDTRKFWFNTPKRAFKTMCRTWQYSPSSDRIVEDVDEFLLSIEMVVESKCTFVDINVHKGRRAVNLGTGSTAAKYKGRTRSTRTKESGLAKLADLHPEALTCGKTVISTMMKNDLKVEADGRDLWGEEPVLMDPEEFLGGVLQLDPEHKNDLWDFIDPDLQESKGEMKAAKERLDKSSKKPAAKAKPAGPNFKIKSKSKAKLKDPPAEYPPPPGQVIEFWGGECFYVGVFQKMVADSEGDDVCFIADIEDNQEVHQIVLREPGGEDSTDWEPLFMCLGDCNEHTYGKFMCKGCKTCKEPDSSDEDYS